MHSTVCSSTCSSNFSAKLSCSEVGLSQTCIEAGMSSGLGNRILLALSTAAHTDSSQCAHTQSTPQACHPPPGAWTHLGWLTAIQAGPHGQDDMRKMDLLTNQQGKSFHEWGIFLFNYMCLSSCTLDTVC